MGADNFKIETSINKALFGFGDAVCVPVISWLARHYLNPQFEKLKIKVQISEKRFFKASETDHSLMIEIG